MLEIVIIFTVPLEILARGPEALRAYQKALKYGKTHDRRVPVMIVGQDRSGKTSLKKSLKRELFDPEQDSTVGIEVDPSLCQIATEVWTARGAAGSINETLATDVTPFEHRAARQTLKNLKLEQQARKESREQQSDSLAERADAMKKELPERKESNRQEKEKPEQWERSSGLEQASTMPEEIQRIMLAKLKAKEGDEDDDDEDEDDAIDLILWDFAGQSVFYTTHPLFMSRIAIYILTHNLSKELDAKAVPLVKRGVYKRLEDIHCETTNMDYIHFWLSSIHAFSHKPESSNTKSEHLPSELPAVLLVGTHADKPARDAKPGEIGMEILSNLDGKPYAEHLVREVFTVDNTRSGSQQDEDEEVKRLRRKIIEVAQHLPHVKEKIPLP